MSRVLGFLAINIGCFLTLGCIGSDKPTVAEAEAANVKQTLQEVYDLVQLYVEQTKNAPQGLYELKIGETGFPMGYNAILEKTIVVRWGQKPQSGSTSILAYYKDVPTAGGSVVLCDGTIKPMTADEFKSAVPKN